MYADRADTIAQSAECKALSLDRCGCHFHIV